MSNIILQGLTITDLTKVISETVRKELQLNQPTTPTTSTPKYYTTKEVASMCGIAEITVHKLKKKGKLKGTYIGRSVRYSEQEVEALLKSKSTVK